jgi:hypothetical protein
VFVSNETLGKTWRFGTIRYRKGSF